MLSSVPLKIWGKTRGDPSLAGLAEFFFPTFSHLSACLPAVVLERLAKGCKVHRGDPGLAAQVGLTA